MKKYLTLDELFEVIQKSFPIDKKEYLAFINQERIAPKTKLNGRNMYEQEDSQFVYEHFEIVSKNRKKNEINSPVQNGNCEKKQKFKSESTIPDYPNAGTAKEKEQVRQSSETKEKDHIIEKMNYTIPQIANLISENKMKIYRFVDQEKIQPIEIKGKTKYYSYEDTLKILKSISSNSNDNDTTIPNEADREVTETNKVVTSGSNIGRVSDYGFEEKEKVPDVTTIPISRKDKLDTEALEKVRESQIKEELLLTSHNINNNNTDVTRSSNKEVTENFDYNKYGRINDGNANINESVTTIPNDVTKEVTENNKVVTSGSNIGGLSEYDFEEKGKVPDVTTIQKDVTRSSNKEVTENFVYNKYDGLNDGSTNKNDSVTIIPNDINKGVTKNNKVVISGSNIGRVSDYGFEEKEKVPDVTTIQKDVTTQDRCLINDKEKQDNIKLDANQNLENSNIKNNKKYFVTRSSNKQIPSKKINRNSKNRAVAFTEKTPFNSNVHNESMNTEITYLKRENDLLRTELNQKNQQIAELSHRLEQEQFLHSRTQGTSNKELPFFKIPEIIEEQTKEEEPPQKKSLFDKFRKNN